MLRRACHIFMLLMLLLPLSCVQRQEGTLEGKVEPLGTAAEVIAQRDGKTVASMNVNPGDGTFRLALEPGTYDVRIFAPSAPFPAAFPGTVIEAGRTTVLPALYLAPSGSSASLSGVVSPAGAGTTVTLLYEGKERASLNTGPEGNYTFTTLPEGSYAVRASSPDYAEDGREFSLIGNESVVRNMRLLYVSSVAGVDWQEGVIRATGAGKPPAKAANAAVRREMAKRAALADGQRNLLRTIEQIRLGPERTLGSEMPEGTHRQRIQGFIKGYRVTAERQLPNGGIELDLELPLTGAGGLAAAITE
jgi:hypothetical protein